MPADKKTLNDLRKCMRDAKGDPKKMAACELDFTTAGGTVGVHEGGKVFGVPGEEAFVTDGGKVF